MHQLFLLLGSNIAPRQKYLEHAISAIQSDIGSIWKSSRIYESPPLGFEAEVNFLNQVLWVETKLNPQEVLLRIQKIEIYQGRQRIGAAMMSRTLDIDMLYYDSLVINTPALTVPHPRLHLRRFTLLPLVEIAPTLVHPTMKIDQSALLKACLDDSEVRAITEAAMDRID